MYNIDEIKELISLLEQSPISVIELKKEDGSKIRLEKGTTVSTVPVSAPAVSQVISAAPTNVESAPVADNSKTINAPIVGVFYVAPSPESQPFVSVGKKVKKGDTVCIIEAMKCMNEIQAEEDGTIVEVLAKDGELVEFGQPLFKIN